MQLCIDISAPLEWRLLVLSSERKPRHPTYESCNIYWTLVQYLSQSSGSVPLARKKSICSTEKCLSFLVMLLTVRHKIAITTQVTPTTSTTSMNTFFTLLMTYMLPCNLSKSITNRTNGRSETYLIASQSTPKETKYSSTAFAILNIWRCHGGKIVV